MIGINTYGLSSALKRDIVGTMSALRDAGVGAIEPCAVFTDALGGMRSAFCRMGFGLAGLTGGTWFGKLADKRTELALKYFDKVAGVHCALAESGKHTAERVVRPALEYAERHGSPFIVFSPMAYTADAVQRFVPALTLAVEICEDLWAPLPPSTRHAMAGATLICNLSASDETIGKAEYRRALVTGQSARLLCGYVYADAGEGESTTDMVFAGHNMVAENGALLAETAPFCGGMALTDIDVERLAGERLKNTSFPAEDSANYEVIPFVLPQNVSPLTRIVSSAPFVPADAEQRARRCDAILAMQASGLKKRLEHTHAKTAVVGISGGLDSCLALLVTVRAFSLLERPLSDIVAVTMPCFGTTERTRTNAQRLCEALGVTLQHVDITQTVRSNFADIGQDEARHDVTYENTQARVRTLVLMNLANRLGGLVIGTGDLSELALGWATYNGDHMSMYGVNASVPKTLIRHIVASVADETESSALRQVLRDILDTPVSPELLPAENGKISQQTEEIVGPYTLHDFFLYYAVRWGFSPAKVYYLARQAFAGEYTNAVLLKWLRNFYRRFFSQQFKRSCRTVPRWVP